METETSLQRTSQLENFCEKDTVYVGGFRTNSRPHNEVGMLVRLRKNIYSLLGSAAALRVACASGEKR
jgi:hypothetical protein